MEKLSSTFERIEDFFDNHANTITVATFVVAYGIGAVCTIWTAKKTVKQDEEYNNRLLMIRALQKE